MLNSENPNFPFGRKRDRERSRSDRHESGMDLDEMEMQTSKRWRAGGGNGRDQARMNEDGGGDEDDDGDGEEGSRGKDKDVDSGRLLAWHSSRIFRVSRASGGKDRHSKVLTAKGLRDRRVRLSVSTAIQFYDLQDRLGYDQPSKAVEWLIKSAANAIAELPSLDGAFASSPRRNRDEKPFDPGEDAEAAAYLQPQQKPQHQHQHQILSLSKSPCSSTSDTSKGSVMSLSRSKSRVKARERARERTAKEKEREKDAPALSQNQSLNPNTQSSFTELLTACNDNAGTHATATSAATATNFISPKQYKHYPLADCYGSGAIYGYFGNPAPPGGLPVNLSGTGGGGEQGEFQHYAFLHDHYIPVAAAAATSEHNLNFSISPSIAGFSRGTLQSNSPQSSLLPHLQRFPGPVVDSTPPPPSVPFLISAAAAPAQVAESQFPTGLDGRLQLYYGDGYGRNSDLKGKGKS